MSIDHFSYHCDIPLVGQGERRTECVSSGGVRALNPLLMQKVNREDINLINQKIIGTWESNMEKLPAEMAMRIQSSCLSQGWVGNRGCVQETVLLFFL